MKNSGVVKNAKGRARAAAALQEKLAGNPQVILDTIPPGFVSGRLSDEIAQLFRDAQGLRKLSAAIDTLKVRPGYEQLEADLREVLGVPPVPAAVPEVAKPSVWRRMFGRSSDARETHLQ